MAKKYPNRETIAVFRHDENEPVCLDREVVRKLSCVALGLYCKLLLLPEGADVSDIVARELPDDRQRAEAFKAVVATGLIVATEDGAS